VPRTVRRISLRYVVLVDGRASFNEPIVAVFTNRRRENGEFPFDRPGLVGAGIVSDRTRLIRPITDDTPNSTVNNDLQTKKTIARGVASTVPRGGG